MAHQADAPDLAGQIAETGADLEVELVEQAAAHDGIVHALGDADGIELRQALLFGHDETDPHRFQAGLQRLVVVGVAFPGVLQAFLAQHHQRFVQCVERIHRRRVVIGALGALAPVTHNQVEIEEPALHPGLAIPDLVDRALAEGDRRQAGNAGETFLGAGIDRVEAPFIHPDRGAAEGSHAIGDHQAIVLVGQFPHALGVGLGAGGSLGVNEGDDLRIGVLIQRLLQLGQIHGAAPGILHHDRGAAGTLDILLHAAAEHAVLAHDDLVARFHQVGETGFHAGGTGCGNRDRQLVVGLKGVLQQLLHLIHHADEHRVEMTDGGPGQGLENARVNIGRAGAHQRANGGIEGLNHGNDLLFWGCSEDESLKCP